MSVSKKAGFLLFLLLLSFYSKAEGYSFVDSSQSAFLIREGTRLLNDLKNENSKFLKQGQRDKLNFVVNLSLDSSGNYISTTILTGKDKWLKDQNVENQLNSKLRQVYFQDTIECYLVLINYLDLKLKSRIPAGITMNDLFNTGTFFNDNSKIDSLREEHKRITSSIISGSIANTNRSNIVLSYGNYCGPLYSDKLTCYTLLNWYKHKVQNDNCSVYFDDVYQTLYKKLQNCTEQQYVCGNNKGIAVTAVDAVVSAAKVGKYKSLIMKEYDPVRLCSILSFFSSSNDYYSLNTDERLHIISVLLTGQVSGNYGTLGPEGFAIKTIRYTSTKEVIPLLHGLEKESVLNQDNNYSGDKSNTDALIYRLVGAIDDSWIFGIGGDNYLKLNQTIADLVMSSQATIDEFANISPEIIVDRMIYWDNKYLVDLPPVGTNKYSVSMSSDGAVKYQRQVVTGYSPTSSGLGQIDWDTYPETNLSPFNLVCFINRSSVAMIGAAGAAPGDLNFMPALFVKYASDKLFNETTMKVVATTIDLATVATGPGLLFKAARAGKLAAAFFETVNTLGAGSNLTLNLLNIQDPKIQALVNQFNGIISIWGLTRLTVSGAYKLSNAFTNVMDESKMISTITEQEARNYIKAYEDAKGTLEDVNYTAMTIEEKNRLLKTNDLLVRNVGRINNSGISSLEEFFEKIPEKYRERIKNDFTNQQIIFKIATGEEVFYRRWGGTAVEKGQWLSAISYSKEDSKILLALPNTNSAQNISTFRLKPGTVYIEGLASSKAYDLQNFGTYALGGGNQIYILREDLVNLIKQN
jgi:hypothetical protein